MTDSNGNSDSTDEWDDDPKSAEKKPESGEEHRANTVPPPESGDAYSADTVIRDVPREALEAIRDKKRVEREAERAARKAESDSLPKLSDAAEDEMSSAKTVAAHILPDSDKPPAPNASPPPPAKIAAPPAAEKAPRAQAPARAPETKPHVYRGPEPVTSGELLTAVAGAVIVIIAGFYLISSAF